MFGPPLILAGGVLAAMVAAWSVGAVRPEASYGSAHPWALRGLFASASLLGGLFAARLVYRAEGWRAFLAGAWLWVLALGLITAVFLPGGSVLYVLPAVVAILGAVLLGLGRIRAAGWTFALATLVLAVLTQPTVPLAEDALFIEASAPFALMGMLLLLTVLPLIWHKPGGSRPVLALAGLATAGFGLAAALVPAYSAEHPQRISVVHMVGGDIPGAVYRVSRDTGELLPEAMTRVAPFAPSADPALERYRRVAEAPPLRRAEAVADIGDPVDGVLPVGLRIADTDRLGIELTGTQLSPRILSIGGFAFPDAGVERLECHGRACRDVELRLTGWKGAALSIDDTAYGLDERSAALLAARPANATPRHSGDRRVLKRLIELP